MAKTRKTGVQGIYRREDSRFYWLAYRDLSGKIIRKSSGSTNQREARAMLDECRHAVLKGKEPIVKKIKNHTFFELTENYMGWSQKQKSFKTKISKINQLVKYFGDRNLRSFDTMLVEQFQTERLRGNQPATVNRLLATLKHMFTKAEDWEMVEEDILKKVRRVKLSKENNKRQRFLSPEEAQSLIEACAPHLRPVVITALNTGMRKEEILSLQWEKNVFLQHGFIQLLETKNGEHREVPINQTLRSELQRITRRLDSPWVFCDPKTGNRYGNMKKSFYSACRKAGITDFRFHDLRHTFASQLVMAGIDITTVKELMGHKTLTMTLRYAHLAPAHKVAAVEMLDLFLPEKSTSRLVHVAGT